MNTLEEQSHPLEALYRARDALQEAALGQRQADLAKQDLPSYGWTLRSVLDHLGELTHVLGDQVDNIDRDRLYREALSDHPYEVIDSAVDHLLELRRTLAVAIGEAEKYRSNVQRIHEDVRDEKR